MKKKYILKAVVAISFALAFLLPTGSVLADPPEKTTTDEPQLDVEFPWMQHGFGVYVNVKNVGNATATDVQVDLSVYGGILGVIKKPRNEISVTIPTLGVDEEVTVNMERFFGYCWIGLKAFAECAEGSSDRDQAIGIQIFLKTYAFSNPFYP